MADPAGRAVRERIAEIVDELPADKAIQVLDFARFIRQQVADESAGGELPAFVTVGAAQLEGLVGLIALGGDAIADSEGHDE